jgi:hypothetical protein
VQPASAQFEREWEKSRAQGNIPSYISSDTTYAARGLAYGMVDDGSGTMVERVLVATSAGSDPINVVVLDASDGTLLDSLDVSNVDDTFRDLNDVGISEDGIIYACNLALGQFGNEDLRCYRWDSLTDTATKVIDGPGWTGDRLGSHISVTGAASDNSLLIHTASVSSDTLLQFTTSDNGSSFSTDTLFTSEEASGTPNVEDAFPAPGGGYYHTWINEQTDQYDASGSFVDFLQPLEADSLTSLQIFSSQGDTYLAGTKVHYAGGSPQGGDARVRIANITNGATGATYYGQTPALGNAPNIQGNADVDVRVNSDGTATVFFLSTNNGIGAFTTNQGRLAGSPGAITIDGQTDDGKYRPLGASPSDQPANMPSPPFIGGVTGLKAYASPESLYVAVEGKVRNGQGDDTFRELIVLVNASTVDGVDAGTPLPPGNAGDSPFSSIDSMRVDMETDFGVRLTGGNSEQAFASIADYAGYVAGDSTSSGQVIDAFEGTINPVDGTPITGSVTGGRYAYDDTADVSTVDGTGFEFVIPHDSLGTSSADEFQFFAFYGDVEGDTLSATIIPDDGATTLYSSSEDWTAVSGMQATGSRTIPVELAAFDARVNETDAVLRWETASETDNAGFRVQHATGEGSWRTLGFVNSKASGGTSSEAQSYRFTANGLEMGTHRFRLEQVDLDGSTSLSSTISVEVGMTESLRLSAPAPNPVTSTTTLSFAVKEAKETTVSLYNVLGQKVRTLYSGTPTAGENRTLRLDANGLASGVYIVRLQADGRSETRRVTIVR